VLEERAGFSPDGLIGRKPILRFAGPETMEPDLRPPVGRGRTGSSSANATGAEGALKLYGTGKQSKYDRKRA